MHMEVDRNSLHVNNEWQTCCQYNEVVVIILVNDTGNQRLTLIIDHVIEGHMEADVAIRVLIDKTSSLYNEPSEL